MPGGKLALHFMAGIIERYTKWLHAQWPAGTVEKLPVSGQDGVTAQPGVRIAGDLTGIPLLKFLATSVSVRETRFPKSLARSLFTR